MRNADKIIYCVLILSNNIDDDNTDDLSGFEVSPVEGTFPPWGEHPIFVTKLCRGYPTSLYYNVAHSNGFFGRSSQCNTFQHVPALPDVVADGLVHDCLTVGHLKRKQLRHIM